MSCLFIATHPSDAVVTQARQRQAKLREHLGDNWDALSWSPPEQFHLTLAFLGKVPADKVSPITDILDAKCAQVSPPELRLTKCGFFARRGVPSVLWTGVWAPIEFCHWCHELRESLKPACPELDTKDFHAHITIARIRRGRSINRSALQELFDRSALCNENLSWRCEKISLLRSDYCREGATHSLLSAHYLGKNTSA